MGRPENVGCPNKNKKKEEKKIAILPVNIQAKTKPYRIMRSMVVELKWFVVVLLT